MSPTRPDSPLPLLVGVDAGGSHTEAVAITGDGAELGRHTGAPGAVRPQSTAAAAARIARVVTDLLASIDRPAPATACCVGAAGAGRAAEGRRLAERLVRGGVALRVSVVSDGDAALESAFPGSAGLVLIAGTGSVAYGRDAEGRGRRAGGLGWQLGDEGSGYALGRAALAAAGRAADARAASAPVTQAIMAATGSADLDALIRWAGRAGRAAVARLARVVCEAAKGGDATAQALVQEAAKDLAALAKALVGRFPDPPRAVALAGGLLVPGSPVRDALAPMLTQAGGLTIVDRPVDAALGAAHLARAKT